jgi:hypothetical protein
MKRRITKSWAGLSTGLVLLLSISTAACGVGTAANSPVEEGQTADGGSFFEHAVQAQDKETLLRIFAEEASWTSDGGGNTKAALKVIHGAELIARFATGVFRKALGRLEFRIVTVNGEPGLAVLKDTRLLAIVSIRSDGQHILDLYAILNPDKLRHAQIS